jgi:Ca2+-binding RTX toxin-like protein
VTIAGWRDGYQNWIERVEFDDGTFLTSDDLLRRIAAEPLVGTLDDDALTGDAGDNVFDGGAGNDQLSGGEGGDTYMFNVGDGADVIREADGRVRGVDVIRFGAGIAAGDITLSRSGDDLMLSVGSKGDAITVSEWGWHASRQIERIEFADGTLWDETEISRRIPIKEVLGTADGEMLFGWAGAADALYGLDGDDTLWANSGDDLLAGGTGNDVLGGQQGSDVYIFNAGDGQDEIYESDAGDGAIDTLRFGDGIDASALIFERSGDYLYINIGIDSDRVSVYAWGENEANQIERIEFADGTVWDAVAIKARIPALVSIGTDDNRSLDGWAGLDDTIVVGYGFDLAHDYSDDDTLRGVGSNDFAQFVTNGSDHDPVAGQVHFLKADQYDSAGLVAHVNEARLTKSGLSAWALTSTMLKFHLYSGTDAALGGDFSYGYGTNASQGDFGTDAARGLLSSPEFGVRRQSFHRTEII